MESTPLGFGCGQNALLFCSVGNWRRLGPCVGEHRNSSSLYSERQSKASFCLPEGVISFISLKRDSWLSKKQVPVTSISTARPLLVSRLPHSLLTSTSLNISQPPAQSVSWPSLPPATVSSCLSPAFLLPLAHSLGHVQIAGHVQSFSLCSGLSRCL